jgi:hypothetical protein
MKMRYKLWFITIFLVAVTSSVSALPNTPALNLHVRGNMLVGQDNKQVILQGVNIPSLEWSNEGEHIMQSVDVALKGWHSNCIRLPLCQDRWFGKAAYQNDNGDAYRKLVDAVVKEVGASHAYVLLDLHWSDAGQWGKMIGQHSMPDDNSLSFWENAAERYKNQPSVLFDLYNEPRDVSLEVWKNGGMVDEKEKDSMIHYHSPGMQKLVDVIRKLGAKNVLVAGGLDWAYDLTGIVNGFALKDNNGNGIMYASHIYPWKRDWDGKVGIAAVKYPVIIGEVGCEPDPHQEDTAVWAPKVLDFIRINKLSWTAWCLHPGATPRLISDWNYTPTPYWGKYVKEALQGNWPKLYKP